MVIEPREKSWGPDYLRFGLGLASDFQGDNQFNLLVQYRKTWLNRLGGEWLTEAQVGQDTHLYSEFYQPVNEAGQLVRGALLQDRADDARRVRRRRQGRRLPGRASAQVGSTPARCSAPGDSCASARVWTRVDASVDTGSPVLPSVKENTAGLRAVLFVDQTDNAFFPTQRLRESSARPTRRWSRSGRRATTSGSRALFRGATELGAAHAEPEPFPAAPTWAPTCRPTSPSRWAARCGCRPTASTSSPGANSRSAA